MKKFIITTLMVLLMATTAYGIAIIDEDGNIIQENEILEGGITTLSGDIGDFELGHFDEAFPAFGSVKGEVVSVTDEYVNIKTEESSAYLNIDINTFIMGEAPAVGDTVTGFFDNMAPMTRIYPPRYTALVIVKRDTDLPFIILDRFNEEWVSSGEQFRLNINDDTPIYFQGGDRFEGEKEELIGRKLLVQYTISHRDIPATIPNPEKITILYERAVHPNLEMDWDYGYTPLDDHWLMMAINLNWYGHEIENPADYEIIITINNISRGVLGASPAKVESDMPNYLPLRSITEAIGFEPQWNETSREITLGSPRGDVTFRIGTEYYAIVFPDGLSLVYHLPSPVVIEGRTYVPFAFFREVFGFTNVWAEGGTVSLDNNERME